jgi:predicted GIY-YIG superfamily endonuclease
MYYVYEIYNPKDKNIAYVGQTKNPSERWYRHQTRKCSKNKHKQEYIKLNGCLFRIIFWSKNKEEINRFETERALKVINEFSPVFMKQAGTSLFKEHRNMSENTRQAKSQNIKNNIKRRKVFFDVDGNKYEGIKETSRKLGTTNSNVRQSLKSEGKIHCKGIFFTSKAVA